MVDARVERLAKLIVNYSIGVKKNQEILISAPMEAEPLYLEMLREVLRAGGQAIGKSRIIPAFFFFLSRPGVRPLVRRFGDHSARKTEVAAVRVGARCAP